MGESSTYDVVGRLRLNAAGAAGAAAKVSNRLAVLGQRIRGADSGFSRLATTALGVGGAYLGITAVSSAIRRATSSAFQFSSELESTRIGLASVLGAVEGTGFAAGMEQAGAIFDQIKDDALTSTATAADMFEIFQNIVGPIRAAGGELSTVRELTRNTVTAAAALGVDLPQAARDMQLMVRGTAGMDTRMFSLLRSMGLITESTEEWNKELTAAQRVERLREALGSMEEAGEAFGRSISGRMSSFQDIVQQTSERLMGPAFRSFADGMGRVNDLLLENRDAIGSTLEGYGERLADYVTRAFDRILDGLRYLGANWTAIEARIAGTVTRARELAPMLVRAAKAWLAIKVARFGAGAAVGGAGLLAGGIGGASRMVAGGAGALMGAAGGMASLVAFAPLLVGGLAALVAVFGLLAPLAVYVANNFDEVRERLAPLIERLEEVGAKIAEVTGRIWEAVEPLAELVGEGVLDVIVVQLENFAWVLENVFLPIIEGTANSIRLISSLLGAEDMRADREARRASRQWWEDAQSVDTSDPFADFEEPTEIQSPYGSLGLDSAELAASMAERPQTVVDMRGSTINVRQEFRDADPDRILVAMQRDLTQQAINRVQSGFVPALTR